MRNILTSLFFIMCAVCFSAPVKSNIGAKGIEYIDGETEIPTAADYVQDGLVAMWDGIENAGWGIHDSEATSCIDLISGLKKPCITYDNYFRSESGDSFNILENASSTTIEVCAKFNGAFAHFIGTSTGPNDSNMARINGVSLTYPNINIRYYNEPDLISFYPLSKSLTHTASLVSDDLSMEYRVYQNGLYYTSRTGTPQEVDYLIIAGARTLPIEVYCVRVYKRVVTPEEISKNYKIDKARFNLP